MKVVLKYSNRKLYDKDTARYTTIGELVKLPLGTFKVEDYETGVDVTTPVLLSALTCEHVNVDTQVKIMKHCITELEVSQ